MTVWDEYLLYSHKLLMLLTEDEEHVSQCIQGEVLEIYQTIIEQEKSLITNARNIIIQYK